MQDRERHKGEKEMEAIILLDQLTEAQGRWITLKRSGAPVDEIETARAELGRLSTAFKAAGGMEAVVSRLQ